LTRWELGLKYLWAKYQITTRVDRKDEIIIRKVKLAII
jgi:hypothetical protein